MTNSSEDLHPWDAAASAYVGHADGPGDTFYRRICLHEPPALAGADIPETQWTGYQKWCRTIPIMLAFSYRPKALTPRCSEFSSRPNRRDAVRRAEHPVVLVASRASRKRDRGTPWPPSILACRAQP